MKFTLILGYDIVQTQCQIRLTVIVDLIMYMYQLHLMLECNLKKNYAHYITTMSPPFKVQITNRHTLDKFEPTCELRPCGYFLNGWLIECCNHVNQVSVLEL